MTNPKNDDINTAMASKLAQLQNPFYDTYMWFKGEYLDLQGLNNSLLGRDEVMRVQVQAESKKKDNQKELDKLNAGKTTLKSVFKSKSSKESSILTLQAAIEIEEQEIVDFTKLVYFLTIYHG